MEIGSGLGTQGQAGKRSVIQPHEPRIMKDLTYIYKEFLA
jgi:hypothetical protein